MEVTKAIREFKYNGVALKDPGAEFTLEQVREFYATLYPEIVNAAIEGPEIVGNKTVYEFRRAVGTKGRDGLTFAELAEVNIARCRRWHDPNGWSPQMWGLAACGEAGEMANALKKLWRHDQGAQQNGVTTSRDELVKAVAMEIGDTVVYLDLLAQRLGLRLEDCVRETFNRISVREGFPERLPKNAGEGLAS